MTTGEQIAKAFSDDKCHLSDAEQRRLAGMIDAELSTTVEALRAALSIGNHVNSQGERISIEKRALAGESVFCLVIHDDPWPGGSGQPAPMLLDTGTKNWLLEMLGGKVADPVERMAETAGSKR